MSEELLIALLTILGTLLGAIVGFFLNELSQRSHDKEMENKQKESVRKIVYLEIEANLELLRKFKLIINDPGGIIEWDLGPGTVEERADYRKKQLGTKLLEIPWPKFLTISYESQLQHFANAFEEYEITDVFNFYNKLSGLVSIKESIRLKKDQENADRLAHPERDTSSWFQGVFELGASYYWNETSLLIDEVLKQGNPISEAKSKIDKPILPFFDIKLSVEQTIFIVLFFIILTAVIVHLI